MVRKGRLHRLQDRPWEMPAAIEPWRWSLKCLIAISHDLAERLVRVGESIALANLDHGRESVGNRRRNCSRAPLSLDHSPRLQVIQDARNLRRE